MQEADNTQYEPRNTEPSQWDEFERKYAPIPNPPDQDEWFLFETYGEDLDAVKAHDPNKVWTLLDTDGVELIVAGYHFVNRTNYILTERAWTSEGEEYFY